MALPNTRKIDLEKINDLLSNKRGIYFWFDIDDDSLVYIGIAVGVGGLKRRILRQHLNPKYLEYRDEKHTSKDGYQLKSCELTQTASLLRGSWRLSLLSVIPLRWLKSSGTRATTPKKSS